MMTTELPKTQLTAEQEIDLARLIEVGVLAEAAYNPTHPEAEALRVLIDEGRAAWEHFFVANLRLAMSLAARAASRHRLDVDDLFQEACLGLAEAIMRFDHALGNRFVTLAHTLIHSRVDAAVLTRCGALELPHTWLRQARARRYQEPDNPMSLYAVVSVAPDQLDRVHGECDSTEELPWWFDTLRARERRLLRIRFGLGCEPHSRRETAEMLEMSESQVRRAEEDLLNKVRNLILEEAS